MKHLSRLVWSEGMYLGPHHFQAQSRYFEDSVQFAISSLAFAAYGFGGYELDAEALRNGTAAVIHARGILPDGLVFQMPDADALPAPRNITELFSPIRESMVLHLAIPARAEGAVNCSLDGNGTAANARYLAETATLHDDNTGRDEKPVRLARKNFRLLLDSELSDGLVTLPIARITRDSSGHFVYDPNFIPPCLEISASERLMMLVRRILEILEDKSASLTRAKSGGKSAAGWSSQEIANFWFLHSIHSALAPLRHLWTSKRGHPEEMFVELLRLAGALCTFGLDSHPRSLPLYDHLNLQECFDALDAHIRSNMEALMPTNCLSIPLECHGNYFWIGPVADQRMLGASRWIFAIRSSALGDAELIERAPRLVKVCSKEFIVKLVQSAMPGLVLQHLPMPPAAISPRLETQYFAVNKAGPCWLHIMKTREVGIYVPGEIPQPEVELLVVLES